MELQRRENEGQLTKGDKFETKLVAKRGQQGMFKG